MRQIRKLMKALTAARMLVIVRMTGEYKVSFWDGEHEYHTYLYRGKYINLPEGKIE